MGGGGVKTEEKEVMEIISLDKPGQKFPTPTPGVAERIFYETLYEQNPHSAMAQDYVVLYGILPEDEAARVYKLVQARKAGGKSNGGYSPSPVAKKKKAAPARKKSKLDDDVAVDTGLVEGGMEGVGSLSFA